MREIKFRYYNKSYQKMITSDYVGLVNVFESMDKDIQFKCEVTEIQQYTGLKDKNGKEIYEGDILEFKLDNGIIAEGLPMRWEVLFRYGAFRITTINERMKNTQEMINIFINGSRDVAQTNNLVIIGNIYENPELLK